MDSSSSSSSSSSPSSSYGVARVSHISNPCIFAEVGSSSSSTYRDKRWKLMKWVSKLFKSGSNGGSGAARTNHYPPQFQEDENMVFPLPPSSLDDRSRGGRDKEELDRAISLSLADDRKRPHGYGWSTDNNRDFPRPFHGGLNPSSFIPPYDPSYQCRRRQRICGGCNRDIGMGNYLGCMGTFFHPECFCCHSCGYAITEHEFSLSGTKPYHKLCFKELTHPKCEVCHHFIPTNDAGLIEYRCHPFWNQKYCPAHEYDKTARCCSCERLESWDVRYYTLDDGRSLCLECMETAITDTGECQPLYHAIRDYYEGMYMKLDQQIPMLLVQREALNDAIVGEKNGYHHMPETRGLCLSEEQTVTSVLRRPRLGAHRLVGMRTQPQKLIRKCEVTAILVLYGLPRLLTGAILAHELMHGWLRLKGYRNLNPEVEEGICQVLSYMWLESEVLSDTSSRNLPSTSSAATPSSSSSSNKKGGKSNVEKKLGEFFKHQIAHDASPAYGGGFRAANAAVCKYGLRPTLDHIRYTGTFPL
ncbi:PREDICTED: protein DA1-related 2-like isoform X2 [Camelina sativa]|uniref:Protein DA1-related 2-like isoform X2 n=1 Tax=Camelina sativa TaxID=90675 RepID=A0ABM0YTK8_CAMSA|nr:PREDICTED: protein DA1-related 2-like isoform X2 [Camelina sativa]